MALHTRRHNPWLALLLGTVACAALAQVAGSAATAAAARAPTIGCSECAAPSVLYHGTPKACLAAAARLSAVLGVPVVCGDYQIFGASASCTAAG